MNRDFVIGAMTLTALLPSASRGLGTANGNAVNVTDYEGMGAVLLNSAAGTGTTPTMNAKLQHSDDGSTGWADIAGAAFSEVTDAGASSQKIILDMDAVKPFIRAVEVIAGTTPAFISGIELLAMKKQTA